MNAQKTISLIGLSAALAMGASAQAGTTAAAHPPASPTTSAAAPATGATRVAIIDIRRVIAATNEGRREYENLVKRFEPKQKEVQGLQAEIDQLQNELKSAQNLSETDRANKVRTLEQKGKNLQRIQEDAQKDFQDQQQEIIGKVGNKLMEVLDKYAKDNGYSVVLDANAENPGPVLWAAEQTRISQEVLDAYNRQSGVTAPAANAPAARPSAPTSKAPATPPKKPATTGTSPK